MKILEKSRMPKPTTPPRSAARGFTLIELMITVAIVAILATIASVSYNSQVQKSRRTDARSAVLDLAGREEKLFSTTNAYSGLPTGIPSDLGYAGAAWPVNVGSNYYSVSVAVGNPPTTYVITATAINSQASDGQCLTLFVDQTGLQSSTGTAPAATCWGN
jgi:type IV pilus assembly protein PilE